jgi:hypothetical protein
MTESEWQTRKTRIDKQLLSLNPKWNIIPYKEEMNSSHFYVTSLKNILPHTVPPIMHLLKRILAEKEKLESMSAKREIVTEYLKVVFNDYLNIILNQKEVSLK